VWRGEETRVDLRDPLSQGDVIADFWLRIGVYYPLLKSRAVAFSANAGVKCSARQYSSKEWAK
jgi:hypothetical protein